MKTSIDIDRDAADEAAEILGTKTLKDTVDAALREVVNAKHRHDLADRILAGTLPVPTQEEYVELRRPKLPVGALEDFWSREMRDT